MAKCVFCGDMIKPGTGFLFVKKDGSAFFFCSRKCERNHQGMHRNPIAVRWTAYFHAEKERAKSEHHGKKKERTEPVRKGRNQAKKR